MHIEMLPNTTSAGAEFSGVSHLLSTPEQISTNWPE
jgi:hypothetical protein